MSFHITAGAGTLTAPWYMKDSARLKEEPTLSWGPFPALRRGVSDASGTHSAFSPRGSLSD